MKRLTCWLLLLGASCGAGWSATIPVYVNGSPTYSPPTPAPIIDARVWINSAIFNISSPILSPMPFQAYNNWVFTNSAAEVSPMIFDPGVRFLRNSGGQRLWMDTWVNKGAIITDHNTLLSSLGLFVSDSTASILQVAATNIIATGPLFSGAHGLIRLEGRNIDVSRNALRTGVTPYFATNFGGGFVSIGASNYVNDLGVTDLYWGGGNGDAMANARSSTMRLDGLAFRPGLVLPSPGSTFHEVVTPSSISSFLFTNSTVVPGTFFSGTNTYFNTNLISYGAAVYTNQLSSTSRLVQVVFYPTNTGDPLFTTDVRFYDTSFGFGFGRPATAVVGFHSAEFDNTTQTTTTNSVYLTDALATTTNYFFARNQAANTRRPNTYEVSRSLPLAYFSGVNGNAAYTSNLFYNSSFTLQEVTNRYSAYAANIGLLSTSPSGSIPYNVTNVPGRVEVIGDRVNLEQTRIRGEAAVIIKANNLVSNYLAEIDAPLVNFDVRSTQPSLVVSNIAPVTVRRLSGTVRAWSAVWNNFEAVQTGTNVSTNTVFFHVMIVESQLRSEVPVTVNEFAARGTNVVLNDNLVIGRGFAVEGSSFHLTGGLTLPFGSGLGNSNIIGVRHFTNDGTILVSGLQSFGTDRTLSYSNYVNRGTNSAASHQIRTRYFENSGNILANGGVLTLDAVTAVLEGTPLITSNFLVTNFTFTLQGIIITNVFTNTVTLQPAPLIQGISDVSMNVRELTMSNSIINAGTLYVTVTNRLADAGREATNFLNVTGGFHFLNRPATSDLFGTHLRSTTPAFRSVEHTWAGADLGPVPAGFTNNLALAKLTLNGGNRSQFRFFPAGTSNALYVDYLELENYATNYSEIFSVAPGLTIYFANANAPVQKLNGLAGGRIRWVPTYAGPLSSTNITYHSSTNSGQTFTFNIALVQSKDLDSDFDGIVNFDDDEPLPVPGSMSLSVTLAGGPDDRHLRLGWRAIGYSTNQLQFKNSPSETEWRTLTNFQMGPLSAPVSITDPISREGAGRVYRLRVDPLPY